MENGVLVVGSLNMDLVMRVPLLPKAGETVRSDAFDVIAGGKGANQAVAAARLGANVTFVGAVGADLYGEQLIAELRADAVDVTHVHPLDGTRTGVAQIVVDAEGNNQIAIAPGANAALGLAHLQAGFAHGRGAKVCLLQLETPLDIVLAAAEMARGAGMTVVLDPAPAMVLPPRLLESVDIITPNETETFALTGVEVEDAASAEQAAGMLLERGVTSAIIKMGDLGALLQDGAQTHFRPAFPVRVVDTTAAGDAFNGALGAALSRRAGLSRGVVLREAVDYAVAASALAVTRPGAQPSLPTARELDAFRSGEGTNR